MLFFIVGVISIARANCQDTILVATQDVSSKYECYYSMTGKPVTIASRADLNKKLGVHRWLKKKCNLLDLDSFEMDYCKNNLIVWDTLRDIPLSRIETHFYMIPKEKKYLFIVKMKRPEFNSSVERPLVIRQLTPRLKRKYKIEYVIQN